MEPILVLLVLGTNSRLALCFGIHCNAFCKAEQRIGRGGEGGPRHTTLPRGRIPKRMVENRAVNPKKRRVPPSSFLLPPSILLPAVPAVLSHSLRTGIARHLEMAFSKYCEHRAGRWGDTGRLRLQSMREAKGFESFPNFKKSLSLPL